MCTGLVESVDCLLLTIISVVFECQFNCELKKSDVKQVGKQLATFRDTFEGKEEKLSNPKI